MTRLAAIQTRLWTTIAVFVFALLGGAQGAHAQTQPIPPEHYTVDPRGVDLVSGSFVHQATEVVIGQPGDGGLAYGRVYISGPTGGWRDTLIGTITFSGNNFTVSVGGISEGFVRSGSTFTPVSNTGSTLTSGSGGYVYRRSDGDTITFGEPAYYNTYSANAGLISSHERPNGERLVYTYKNEYWCTGYYQGPDGEECIQYVMATRLQSVANNFGYQLHYDYLSDVTDNIQDFQFATKVTGFNEAVDWCARNADDCTFSRTWPSVSYDPLTRHATDQSGRVTQYNSVNGALATILYPGSTAADVTITSDSARRAIAVTDASGAWTYSYATSGPVRTTTSTGPLGQSLTVVSDLSIGRATSVANAAGQTWSYQYDGQRRLSRVTNPELDYVELTYDARGNVTNTRAVPKPGSGLADITTSATFTATCANPVICNKPLSHTDARGNVTDYIWDPTHGGLISVTLPAPTGGAARPETRYSYASFNAYAKNSVGAIVAQSPAVTLPIEISACSTGASCDGGANEVVTTIAYGAPGVANNLLPTSISQGSGTNPTMAVVATTYNPNGDVETVDGPLAGASDSTRYRYDVARQLIGIVGPDPDGGGALLNRAQRYTYNPRGQVTLIEVGTTPGYTDPNWANFVALQRQETAYDGSGRLVQTVQQSAAGVAQALQQVSYDAAGRAVCSATRMNAAVYGSLPVSACTQGTAGSYGPDRIVQVAFDAVGRIVSTTTAVGTGDSITEAVSYTANGQPATLSDGNGNVSILVYDGFDRVSRLRYPDATCCGTSTTDYEEYGYDAGSNLTSYRNRGGDTFTLTYDALGRLTTNDAPVGTSDVHYAYDNLGRSVCVSSNPPPTCTNVYTYDALGRQLTETGPLGTMASQYDSGGRRTRLTWPDAMFAAYEYDLYGAMTEIRENGSASLASYAYDNLGRRTGVARGNGVTTSYGYDAISRLNSLGQDFAATGQDLSVGLTYNPGNQITGRTASNETYVFAPVTGTTSYTNNGRNQVTNTGTTVTYDGRGNITGALGASYGYDARNALVSAGTATYQYDPLGRLFRANGASDTRFQYDGVQATTEYDAGGAVVRRHVPGPSLDETVVSYAGSGTSSKTWLVADERGSVIGLADASGGASVNRYDEYGAPASGNVGRFQYTGQMWLEDAGLYHFRARVYAPALGRFLQSDPIGYAAGANLYAYVGADPVNRMDPFGLLEVKVPIEWFCWWSGTAADPYRDFGGCRETDWTTIYINDGPSSGAETGSGPGSGSGSAQDACSAWSFAPPMPGAPPVAVQPQTGAALGRTSSVLGRLAGVLGLVLSLGGDTPRPPQYYNHYTTAQGFAGITSDGFISPSADGYVYLTPDRYTNGRTAMERLALSRQPVGYFRVPARNAAPFLPPAPVRAWNGQPGGGTEVRAPHPVSISGSTWVPLC